MFWFVYSLLCAHAATHCLESRAHQQESHYAKYCLQPNSGRDFGWHCKAQAACACTSATLICESRWTNIYDPYVYHYLAFSLYDHCAGSSAAVADRSYAKPFLNNTLVRRQLSSLKPDGDLTRWSKLQQCGLHWTQNATLLKLKILICRKIAATCLRDKNNLQPVQIHKNCRSKWNNQWDGRAQLPKCVKSLFPKYEIKLTPKLPKKKTQQHVFRLPRRKRWRAPLECSLVLHWRAQQSQTAEF